MNHRKLFPYKNKPKGEHNFDYSSICAVCCFGAEPCICGESSDYFEDEDNEIYGGRNFCYECDAELTGGFCPNCEVICIGENPNTITIEDAEDLPF